MNRYLTMICFLFVTASNAQQVTKAITVSHYLLDTFYTGKILMKSGEVFQRKLNYNILTGEMIFSDNGRNLAIEQPSATDTVFVTGRKFVPVEKEFYEVLLSQTYSLYVEYNGTLIEPGASIGYGNASPTTNAISLSSLIRSGMVYEIKLPDDYKVTTQKTFWVRKDGKLRRANTLKQLISIFPEKKQLINDFVKANKTDYSKPGDVVALMQQLQ